MRKSISRLKSFFSEKFKKHRPGPKANGGTYSSAATGGLALPSPQPVRSVPSGNAQFQNVELQTVRPQDPQPQDSSSHDAQLQTTSEVDSSAVGSERGPWALAFDIVRKRDSKLMLAYEEYLSSLQGDTAADSSLSSQDFIKQAVHRAIEDRERNRWHVSLLGTDIEVRKQAERLSKFLLWSDSIVKLAVSNQPYMALGWSGVSILLPLVTSSITQLEEMLRGFNTIGDVQMYWRIYEEACLSTFDASSRQHLAGPLANLYSYIIEYQARAICHLSKKRLTRAWADISSPGEWGSKIEEIDRHSKACRSVLHLLNLGQIKKHWEQQLSEMQESQEILQEIRKALQETEMETRRTFKGEKTTELLRLLASDYQGDKDFNPQKVDGTCEWFFADERFRNWRDSDDSRLLWVSAGPGCGKSVLSRALIDERRLSTNVTTSTICYFFFKDGDESKMYAHSALCALLHQLLTQDSTGKLIEKALASYENFGETLKAAFSELWNILIRCANSLDSGEIICLIDALDECHAESRMRLVEQLTNLYQHGSQRPPRLKFLITSRPYDNIESSFRRLSTTAAYFRFDGDDKSSEIEAEINLVIDARVNEFAQYFEDKDRQLIAKRLKEMENRTYLWLHLTLDIISKDPSGYGRRVDIETLLSSLPSEVSEAYEKILDKSKRRDYTEALLEILLAATRPLTLEEANCALTLATKEEPFESFKAIEDEIWPPRTFKDDVKNLCGLFISVYDGKLFFIHHTAREFLLSPNPKDNWKGRFTMPKSHSRLSSACLRYLLLPEFPATQVSLPCSDTSACVFLPYVARSWPLHYTSQEPADASLCWKEALMVCRSYHLWLPYRGGQSVPGESFLPLPFATRFNLGPLVAELLRGNENSNADISKALYVAAVESHGEILQMLLDHGADVNAALGGSTALMFAIIQGDREIVQILLHYGADVSIRKYRALRLAVTRGYTEIAQMLLDHGEGIHEVDVLNEALQEASGNGHTEIVQMLRQRTEAFEKKG